MLQRVAANAAVDIEKMNAGFKKRVMGLMACPATPRDVATPLHTNTGLEADLPEPVTVETFKALVHSLQTQVAAIKAMQEQATPDLASLVWGL